MYGGGGPMSVDYLETMRVFASMGIRDPWTRDRQIGCWGIVLALPEQRATYVDPVKEREREQGSNN